MKYNLLKLSAVSAAIMSPVQAAFQKESMVTTPRGQLEIGRVKKGDYAHAFSPRLQANGAVEVVSKKVARNTMLEVEIDLGARTIRATPDQKLFDVGTYNWIAARDLTTKNVLLGEDGSLVDIHGVRIKHRDSYRPYDLSVSRDHTLFVDGVLCHNMDRAWRAAKWIGSNAGNIIFAGAVEVGREALGDYKTANKGHIDEMHSAICQFSNPFQDSFNHSNFFELTNKAVPAAQPAGVVRQPSSLNMNMSSGALPDAVRQNNSPYQKGGGYVGSYDPNSGSARMHKEQMMQIEAIKQAEVGQDHSDKRNRASLPPMKAGDPDRIVYGFGGGKGDNSGDNSIDNHTRTGVLPDANGKEYEAKARSKKVIVRQASEKVVAKEAAPVPVIAPASVSTSDPKASQVRDPQQKADLAARLLQALLKTSEKDKAAVPTASEPMKVGPTDAIADLPAAVAVSVVSEIHMKIEREHLAQEVQRNNEKLAEMQRQVEEERRHQQVKEAECIQKSEVSGKRNVEAERFKEAAAAIRQAAPEKKACDVVAVPTLAVAPAPVSTPVVQNKIQEINNRIENMNTIAYVRGEASAQAAPATQVSSVALPAGATSVATPAQSLAAAQAQAAQAAQLAQAVRAAQEENNIKYYQRQNSESHQKAEGAAKASDREAARHRQEFRKATGRYW